MAIKKDNVGTKQSAVRLLLVSVAVMGAFFGAYAYASARSGEAAAGTEAVAFDTTAAASGAGSSSGCACCGSSAPTENGLTGEVDEGTAKVEGDIQKIDVDLSQGYYSPNQIVLEAGVPAEITFGQSSGCTAQVMSNELGFFEDLSGGARTVKLPALEAGEYPFYCGMQMVYGKIVVK